MTISESRSWRRKAIKYVFFVPAKGRQADGSRSSSFDFKAETAAREEEEKMSLLDKISSIPKSDWLINIQEKLDQVPPLEGSSSWLNNCIFRVPENLREIEPKAYIPQVVSIGPYHRGKACLKFMERHKWRLLRHVIERTGHSLELYLEAMAELEEKTRRCYANSTKVSNSREFIEMMLLDACFILELLRVSVKGFIYCGYSWGDPIFTCRGVLPSIQRDLLKLENQLPLFVLDRLFSLTCEADETITVTNLALQFFESVGCEKIDHSLAHANEPGLHFLHVVRQSLLPSPKATFGCAPIMIDHQAQLMMHCVSSLKDSGVKFRKKKSEKFMDIEFKNGFLYIPPLVIHDSTKAIFLNLMVFEQCYPHCSNHVTSYISFMDGLINCPRDVGHLRFQGIIDHGLGSEEEVAGLFNKLCKEIAFDINDCYLSGVSAEVNKYFDRRWHTWRATLKHEYFSNPWAILSLLAAILLIFLTLAQTFYTVLAYHFPS
ncbi:hypothetical protein GIB67_014757 [Kingdonia uniflora]|uniref:Uncharacterized protein n=1 Tax=Kingdonia uniflora TaxID=39325 RepID=A0A7J7NV63_9MAGN|nr:hypothetical protein GIB67_014757 [Kingdonia uniflora]